MPTCAAYHFEVVVWIAHNTTNDSRNFLPALRLDAFNQVLAALLIEQTVLTVVPGPHAASGRIDQFMGTRHHRT